MNFLLDFHCCSTKLFPIVTGAERLSIQTRLVQAGLSQIWLRCPENRWAIIDAGLLSRVLSRCF
jgi:hypothetical protein